MTLPDRIRQALAEDHTAIETTGFARAMISGRISATDYAEGLAELYHLHVALEAALTQAAQSTPAVAALFHSESMNRSRLIARDLECLGFPVTVHPGVATATLSEKFDFWASLKPWMLLGPLYVLEGSRMGSMVLVRSLAPALGVGRQPGQGLDYHLDGIATRPQDWQKFRGQLAALPLSAEEQSDVLDAAMATMRGLVEMYSSFHVSESEHVAPTVPMAAL